MKGLLKEIIDDAVEVTIFMLSEWLPVVIATAIGFGSIWLAVKLLMLLNY